MLSSFKPGDHVVTFNWTQIRPGDVVTFHSSRHPGAIAIGSKGTDSKNRRIYEVDSIDPLGLANDKVVYYIKRVYKIAYGNYYVSGDNKRESANVGPIKKAQIVGKVILKY